MYARSVNRPKARASQLKAFPAPVGGWVANRNLANPSEVGVKQGAAILDNFFPRASSVMLRRGKVKFATVGDGSEDVVSLFSYSSGGNERLFAATATAIYDITAGDQETAAKSGFTGGDWSIVQFSTTGGDFLIGVNGKDAGFLFDGSSFTDLGVTFTTGVTSADMIHVWVYKSRLWFARKLSTDAWYGATDSIAGAATVFPLQGIFTHGGALLFGQNWSLEGGAEGGLSEQCIFATDKGEVAVFQGVDPDQADTWSKVGVYRVGTPLGKRAFMRGGGDLAIATSVGLVPLSKAISLDITALSVATVSYNISDAWADAVTQRGLDGWQCELWPEQKMAVVSPPNPVGLGAPVLFIANTETGAWARYTNWAALCMDVFQGALYFGSPGGAVFLANASGSDDGEVFSGAVLPLFEDLGSPASMKIGKVGRAVVRGSLATIGQIDWRTDFDMTLPSAPNAIFIGASSSAWGTGVWGESRWNEAVSTSITQDWQSIAGLGYTCSLAYQVSSGSIQPLDVELIRLDALFEVAEMVS